MTVIIQNGEYKGCLAQVFHKGVEAYFRDELLESDILLKNYEYINAEEFKCPKCGTYWEDRLSQLTCPCLEE